MAPLQKLSVLAILLTLAIQVSSQGTQFITGACANDAACQSGCCGFNSGKCAGPIVAQERDGGCGFGDAQPNDRAAQLLRGGSPAPLIDTTPPANITAPVDANITDTTPPASPIIITPVEPVNITTPAPEVNNTAPAVPAGTQFITGVCTSDATCASKCCGFKSGKCAGPIVAQERDGGCGFGNAVPNDDAARALTGKKRRGVMSRIRGVRF